MIDVSHNWVPEEWEDYAYGLLQDRHGVMEIDKVPAQHKGDFGIDYYCPRLCIVYQCYAAQEPLSTADRAKKQKVKITDDIRKFCSNSTNLKKIIGPIRVTQWVLVVPRHTSAYVNAHLTLKTNDVLAKNLSYVAPGFRVSIHALDSFNINSRNIRIQGIEELSIPTKNATDQDVLKWRSSSPADLLNNLNTKLNKRVAAPADIDFYIKLFLEKENAIDYLRSTAPGLYEAVNKAINRKLKMLNFAGPHTDGVANSILRQEIEGLIILLNNQIHNLSSDSADIIAYGTLSDWLMRCPLDFPPYQS